MASRGEERSLNSDDLVERLLCGDEQAFEQVFRTYYARVYSLAYRLMGSAQEADEVAQQAFLRLYQQPPRSAQQHSLLAWLLRVASNLGLNAIRAERRRRGREERAWREEAATPGHEDEALCADRAARVRQALLRLPERQAQVLLLRHQGLSYAEVAEAVGIAPGSVGTILVRAERAFQAAYRELEATEKDVSHA